MSMKEHILDALREQIEAWEALIASLEQDQLSQPLGESDLSVKDTLAHLHAWQERSVARLEAGLQDRPPEYPAWVPDIEPDDVEVTDKINAWLYDTYHDFPWEDVYRHWLEGYLRVVELGEDLSERDLLDGSRYPWLSGFNLADTLLATYDHHQEHYDYVTRDLQGWQER